MPNVFVTDHLFHKFYYGRPGFTNGTSIFHQRCAERAPARANILEIGAGSSNGTSDFIAKLGTVTGLDVSKEVATNRALESWKILEGAQFPFEDDSFDCCFSNWVLEHISNPMDHFREILRVLRPGGAYCFRTVNILHYIGAVSKTTPHWFHCAVANRLRRADKETRDPWPTFYRCNTQASITNAARVVGFEDISVNMVETEPSYAKASPVLFWPMLAWERVVNSTAAFENFRAVILATLRK